MLVLTCPGPFASGAAPWAPTDLANLTAWWKADAITGLVDGDPVVSWSASAGSVALTNATSTYRPLYRASGPNSKPYVDFSAGGKTLWGDQALPNPFTLFVVWSPMQVATSGKRVFEFYNVTAASGGRIRLTASGFGMYAGDSAAATSGPQLATGVYAQNWQLLTTRWGVAADAHLQHNVSALRTSAGDMSPTVPTRVYLGGSSISASNSTMMYVAEVIIYGVSLSTTDEATVQNYLNTKYAVY